MVHPIIGPLILPYIRTFMKEIKGRENIPKNKGFIIAANHASFYDDFAVPAIVIPTIKKKVHFYVNDRFYKFLPFKWFLDNAECIPISVKRSKNSSKTNSAALNKALYYLEKKDPVGIFPEGGRSSDGKIRQAKTGIAYLLLKAKVPVLPIGIEGSNEILPKGAKFFRFGKKCKVKIGKLMHFSKYYNRKINKTTLNKITREIMQEIAKLSNQKYNF